MEIANIEKKINRKIKIFGKKKSNYIDLEI